MRLSCLICKKEVVRSKIQIERSNSGNFFCSKSCQAVWRNREFSREKHANWKNGLYAYQSVLSRAGIMRMCRLCGLADVRVISVHHVDHDHTNDGIKNLVWLCRNCHYAVHHDRVWERRLMEILV